MTVKNEEQHIAIRVLLMRNKLDVAKLARRIRRSRTWTSLVLYGHEKSEPTRKAIADALGKRVEYLWPESPKKKAA